MGDETCDIKIRIGGGFVLKKQKNKQVWVDEGGWTHWKKDAQLCYITIGYLRFLCVEAFVEYGFHVPTLYNLWYIEKGKTWNTGKREIVNDEEVSRGFIEAKHKDGYLQLFCTVAQHQEHIEPNPPDSNLATQNKQQSNPTSNQTVTKPSVPLSLRRSPRHVKQTKDGPNVGVSNQALVRITPTESPQPSLRRSPRFLKDPTTDKEKRKGKRKCKRKLFSGSESGSGSITGSSTSDVSDLGIDWNIGEEEAGGSEDEQWHVQTSGEIVKQVQSSLNVNKEDKLKQLDKDISCNNLALEEKGSESDELRSLQGSDEEEDGSPWFREETDFKKPVVLVEKLQFNNSTILRKALRTHAVENRYEYYYLHNGGNRITTFCKRRCACVWDSKRSKLPTCTCSKEVRRCRFKVIARRLFNSAAWQIKKLNLTHRCMRSKENSKVTAEYLAEKYLEEWRSNPTWRISSFEDRVFNDLGIQIRYSKAWLARSRVKLIIYGSASEKYARVWDYGKAVIKYNPGSGVCVVVDDIEKPERPLFMRMFICLAPLRIGFFKGCRPLIGVDGCHLKGAYPGQILVAVGKDGNNNIFPFAWATVEVENKDSWCWFLQSLKKELGDEADGAGYTYMSDRQKGLLEAFELMVPKAEKRFCVRHIWANFKLQFSGATFKELFWNAARATTMFDFEVAMESIKFLSEDAYDYLANIPAKHWSRHAFSTISKSNMLLNNICETFNVVIKDARDKPILTQMEWMRKYMMKRNNDKWENACKLDGRITPYVTKIFEKLERVARHCIVQVSRGDSYEVELNGDQVLVNLGKRTCTCFHWQLTGIPCVHGFACILDKRVDPEDFVDNYYTKETYMVAYEDAIQPMPGAKHWEKINLREPLPPRIRVMPGRPKSKKRKLERGEVATSVPESSNNPHKVEKTQKRCRNCGQLGHYAKTCQNAPSQATTASSQTNKTGKPILNTPWMIEQRRIKEARALRKTAEGAGPWSIANRTFPQESGGTQPNMCSQASTTTTSKHQSQDNNKNNKK